MFTASTYDLLRFPEPPPAARPIDEPPAAAQPGQEPAAASARRFLYVTEQGVMLKKVSQRLVIMREKTILAEIPMLKLECAFLYGNIQLSTQCMRALIEEGIRVSFFTRQGTFKGSLVPPAADMASLRIRQYQRTLDPEFCLRFARAVIRGKILSQRSIAAAYARDAVADSLSEDFRALDAALARLESTSTLDEVRGVEGSASRAYFQLFRRWNVSEFDFDGREKRGANDPINILLNLGYSMLTRELAGLAEAAGLDPVLGPYHQVHSNRPSLACDWVEEFRHGVVDRTVLTLLNRGHVRLKDFHDGGDRGRRLTQDGLRKFLTAYERALKEKGYRDVMFRQLGVLIDAIRDGDYVSHLERAPDPKP